MNSRQAIKKLTWNLNANYDGTSQYITFSYAKDKRPENPATLRKDLNIASGTMTKMRRNEEVALSVLLRICEYLNCNIGDICDVIRHETE